MPNPAFRYTHYDLKEQRAGVMIEITLSAVANVRLMNAQNFQRFTETLNHKFRIEFLPSTRKQASAEGA